ncbi:2-dehydropantoate 2-reductase [Pseudophaeobacter sp. EL27]|uniref:2-dehydropantoate 2-reductase n=1 Tax=Pseudophaeobacter sp. EL27 TaxID=2107580 RepID=UPI000EFCAAA9|nr:2-dehydropantoate 2-reductase [Pseudophaeobacter sp. EL27]
MSQQGGKPLRIAIAGAGAIGCFCGGLWAAAGHSVSLLGRSRVLRPVAQRGLLLSDYAGLQQRVEPQQLRCSEDPAVLAEADLVVVAVKSSGTAAMGQLIAQYGRPDAPVLSFQNAMTNAQMLSQMLPGRDVRAAMVPFNVVPAETSEGAPPGYHRASSGDIMIAAGGGHWGRLLSVPGLPVVETSNITGVQWGKLLINLNNALNALSGIPLMTQLQSRHWRQLMADQMAEALRVMRAAGLRPVSTTPLPVWMSPHILRLPNWAFTRIAAQMLTIDPTARSSMAQDLMQGRITEVDALQGEVQRLGLAHGVPTPICDVIILLIRQAEMKKAGLPKMQPGQI